ncbi:MAG TPA: hypothetical protein VGS07_14730 [Thermoanaerobaculia bacterium]|jgi:hypothetical protein|nr:hypothetical protein [Thermoanaerobaculia bacterium]
MHTYQVDNLIQWTGTLAILGGLTLLAYRWLRRSSEQRHELRLKILERFSSQEFVALLETEGGRQWMADVLSGRSGSSDATEEGRRRAIVLTCIGAGLIGSAFVVHSSRLGVLGALILSGSIGLWIAIWATGRRSGPH